MKLSMALLLTVAAPAAAGGWVTAAALEDGGKQLVLMTRSGPKSAPREADQVGFSQPRVSSDGQYAGWLVLHFTDADRDGTASFGAPVRGAAGHVRLVFRRERRRRGVPKSRSAWRRVGVLRDAKSA